MPLLKRLCHLPSGTSGSDSSQCFHSRKSELEIRFSRYRLTRRSRLPLGGGNLILGMNSGCEPVQERRLWTRKSFSRAAEKRIGAADKRRGTPITCFVFHLRRSAFIGG